MGENGSSFVICVERGDYLVSLEVRKVYQTLPDPFGAKHGLIRVIDESDEDYLYSADWFVPIKLPPAAKKAFPANPQPTPATPPAARRAAPRTPSPRGTAP